MKYVVIEVPYGSVLALPAHVAACFDDAHIIDRPDYDWDNLIRTSKPIECRFVEAETFRPEVVPTNEPEPLPAVMPPPMLIDAADIPF